MRSLKWFAAIPVLLNLAGVLYANRVTPFVFGLPFLLAWVVGSVVATSLVMWLVYRLDPANREDG
jgi:hypothetical protein